MFNFYDEIGSFGLMVMEGFRSCYMVGVSRGSKVWSKGSGKGQEDSDDRKRDEWTEPGPGKELI